jgi:5-methylcytosine-specific restriction endonuclease McrA
MVKASKGSGYRYGFKACCKACHNAEQKEKNRKKNEGKEKRRGRVTKNCVICSAQFTVIMSRADMISTCGLPECRSRHRAGTFAGRHHTDQSKEAMSAAKRGRPSWRKGKFSTPRYTVSCSCGCGAEMEYPEWRIESNTTGLFFLNLDHKNSFIRRENHPLYRGGSHPYGNDWPEIARRIRERDVVCQACGKTAKENGRALDVHHKRPWRVSKDNSDDNLITLCQKCHAKETAKEKTGVIVFLPTPKTCEICGGAFFPQDKRRQARICGNEDCKRERNLRYQKKYWDKAKALNLPSYEKKRTAIRRWEQENKERVNARNRAYRARAREARDA